MIKKIFKTLSGQVPEPPTPVEYFNQLTEKVIERICSPETVCVDVGAHEGRILQLFTTYSPNVVHLAFEPLPNFYFGVKRKFASAAKIYKVALSNKAGSSPFTFVTEHPSRSGLKATKFNKGEKLETLQAKIAKLDDYIKHEEKIGLIKIEASGGEYDVLLGAKSVIERCKPHILFSFSKANSDAYNVSAEQMRQLLEDYGYSINVFSRFLSNQPAIPFLAFKAHHIAGDEDLFIAVPA